MTDVRHYYDVNATLPLKLLYIPSKGRDFLLLQIIMSEILT
jgi:hypothetical protein